MREKLNNDNEGKIFSQEFMDKKNKDGFITTGHELANRIWGKITEDKVDEILKIVKEFEVLGHEVKKESFREDLAKYLGVCPNRAEVLIADLVGAEYKDLDFLESVVISSEDGVNAVFNAKSGKLVKQESKYAYEHMSEYNLSEEDFEDFVESKKN